MTDYLFCPNKIEWGDVATWMAGIGALAAAIVALVLARRSDRKERSEKLHSGRVFAIYIAPEVGQLRAALPRVRRRIQGLIKVAAAKSNWPALSRMIASLDLPLLRQSIEKITLLDGDDAKFVASTLAGLTQLKSVALPWGQKPEDVAPHAQVLMEPLLALAANLQRYVNGAHRRIWIKAGFTEEYPIDPDSDLDEVETSLLDDYDRRGAYKAEDVSRRDSL